MMLNLGLILLVIRCISLHHCQGQHWKPPTSRASRKLSHAEAWRTNLGLETPQLREFLGKTRFVSLGSYCTMARSEDMRMKTCIIFHVWLERSKKFQQLWCQGGYGWFEADLKQVVMAVIQMAQVESLKLCNPWVSAVLQGHLIGCAQVAKEFLGWRTRILLGIST